jgi:hypothetical protein
MLHIDYGLGVFHRNALSGCHTDLAEVYRGLLAVGDLSAYETSERFYEIGSFDGIRDLSTYLTAA